MFEFFSRFFHGKPNDGPITIALPDPLTMIYGTYFRVESGDDPTPDELRSEIVSWLVQLNEPLGPALTAWVEKGLLSILVSRGEEAPPAPISLLQAMGMGAEEERRFKEATHVAIFSSPDRLQPPRFGLWAAWTAARAIADSRSGVVIDVALPRLLNDLPMHEEFPDDFRVVMSKQIVVPFSRDRRGLCWMTTKGMSKFGLPELEIVDVPPNLPDSLVPVINGVASILVEMSMTNFGDEADSEAEAERSFSFGPEIRINTAQIAEAFGEQPVPPEEGVRGWSTIRLEYRPGRRGQESFLRLVPPSHFNHKGGVWLNSLLVDLLGVKREILVVADDDEVMAKAHAQALETLPDFKRRFQEGPELGQQYFVKHGFSRDDSEYHEFMWVVVKTWTGNRIQGILANDPRHRIDLRSGQAVTLTDADVFDWLLTLPDGTHEGGFTNIAAAAQGHEEVPNDDDE